MLAGLRLGLYTPIKNTMAKVQQQAHPSISSSTSINSSSIDSSASVGSSSSSSSSNQTGVPVKVLAGTASGALAAALLSPTELVKVRAYICCNRHPCLLHK